MEGEGEEDDQRAERQAEVEPRGREEVEAAPPREVALADEVLEEEADDAPGQVVERGGRGDGAGAAEDDGGHEVPEVGLGPPLGGEVERDGDDGADAEEDEEAGVDLPWREDAGWPDQSPDHRG